MTITVLLACDPRAAPFQPCQKFSGGAIRSSLLIFPEMIQVLLNRKMMN